MALGESSALSAETFRWSLGLQKQAVYCEVIICAVSPLSLAAFILYSTGTGKSKVRLLTDSLKMRKLL